MTYTSSDGLVQSFTVPAGTASTTMPVQINGNTTGGENRTLTVDLTGVAFSPDGSNTTDSVAVGAATGTAPIVDDDWRIASLASNPANATISEAGGATIDFQVTLVDAANPTQAKNAPSNHPITVDFALADGTGAGGAVYGHDYQTTDPAGKKTGTLTFAPGTSVVHVKVQGINDNVYGLDKQFSLTLSNPTGASFNAGATIAETGTITESTAAPIVSVQDCATVTGGGDATFPLRTSYASPVPATVSWATSDVSTIAGDYDGGNGTATVPANSRDGSITIHTHANPPSGDRVFHVTISNGQHTTILTATAGCTIHQPSNVGTDKLPSLQVTDPAPVAQPATGQSPVNATIKITLSPPAVQPPAPAAVNVHWQTQPGTATAPGDYTDASGDLHWDAGTFGPQSFTVQINPYDGTGSGPQKFTVQFTTITAAFVGANAANVTVVPPTSPPVISVSDASALESAGSIPVLVSLAPAPTGPVTVHYATADGSAKAGTDYTAVSGTLSFAAGQTSKTVNVPISDDNTPEPNKSFTFTLSAPTGGSLGNAVANLTIRNDDSAPAAQPPIVTQPAPPQPKPTPVPTPQPKTPAKHVVLVQMLSGQSIVDNKGYAHYMLRCPVPAVKRCVGTIVLEVRVQPKKKKGAKKAPPLKTVTVGSGKFTITVGKSASVKVKVSRQGLTLLESYHRIRVKATVKAKDQQNVKGVTAWFVTVQAPARQITVKSP